VATDATGTPTSLGIPTYNVDADAPSGLGNTAQMQAIDALIAARISKPSGIVSGEVPVWNGTTWVRSSTTGLAAAGVAAGSAGQILATVSGATTWIQMAQSQITPADPAGTSSASTVMMGLAGSITPAVSGRVLFTVQGQYTCTSTTTTGITLGFRTGTGSAPVNGAPSTGTSRGNAYAIGVTVAGAYIPFSLTAIATGLAVGTALWFDIPLSTSVGTVTLARINMTAVEF